MGKAKELINQWIKNILSNPFKSIAAVIGVAIPLYLFFFPSPAQEEQQELAKKAELSKRLNSLYGTATLLLNECPLAKEMKKSISAREIANVLMKRAQEVDESVNKVLELKQYQSILSNAVNEEITKFVHYFDSLAGYIEGNGTCPEKTKSQTDLKQEIDQIINDLSK